MKAGAEMQAITGIFQSRAQAEHAVREIQASGFHADRVTLLTPGENIEEKLRLVPVDNAEQPGMGEAVGGVVGGAAGLSGGIILTVLPAVGPVGALGILGAAILTAAGATVGAEAGKSLEDSTTRGLPEDEIFVYEDALRRGRSVVIALAENETTFGALRELLQAEGAEAVDAAREQWWIGLRSAEQEHYHTRRGDFAQDELFYRLGFEAALHARNRCREFAQVSAEMTRQLEDLKRRFPGVELEEPFTRGYRRGREYYQSLCDHSNEETEHIGSQRRAG